MKDDQISEAGAPAGAPRHRPTSSSHRILVVDDDLDLRLLSADVLFHSGYEVDTADDGEAGWQALQARDYDLLITDNQMPQVSGVELVKKLRFARMTLPVILASGAMPEEQYQIPWLQLSATLLKPFTPAELLGIVKRVLRVSDSTCELTEPMSSRRSQQSANALRVQWFRLSTTHLTRMFDHLAPRRPLPCREDRQKIIEQAEFVLTQARAIAEQSDQVFALLSAQRPLECTNAATSCSSQQGRFPDNHQLT